jgi:nucleoid-associated protein YgaU
MKRTAVRRVRTIEGIAVLAAVFTLVTTGGVAMVRSLQDRPASSHLTVRVQPGDTLWSLARRAGGGSGYLPQRVEEIAAANGLRAGDPLQPGQSLRLPVSGVSSEAKLRLTQGR